MKPNTWTWLLLLTLTVVSYCIDGRSAAGLILIAAGVKATMVGWQFMELRSAHPIWRLALAAVLTGVLALVYLLVRGDTESIIALLCNAPAV